MTRYRPLSLPLSLVGMLLTSAWPSMALAQPIAPEFASVWNFFRREAEDRRAGGNGSPRTPWCSLTPQEGEVVWNRTPLFVWYQPPGTFPIRIGLAPSDRAILWQNPEITVVADDDGPERYRAYRPSTPLEPDTYDWRFFVILQAPVTWISFAVMELEPYDQIAAELATLDATLTDADAETLALAHMTFFAERNLAADALQTLFSVADPSPAFQKRQDEVIDLFCND